MRSLMKRTAEEQTRKRRTSLRVDVNLANLSTSPEADLKSTAARRTPGRRRRICAAPPFSILSFDDTADTKTRLSNQHSDSTKISRPLSKKLRKVRDLHCARAKGTVSLCVKKSTGTYVVLKRVNKRMSNPFGRGCVFLDVYESLSRSPHSCCLGAEATSELKRQIEIQLPFIRGGDLFEFISRAADSNSPLQTSTLKRMVRDVARGVSHLHGLGFAHMDLAAENVLVDISPIDGHVNRFLVMDYDLSLRIDKTSGTSMMGSDTVLLNGRIGYSPPEVLDIQKATREKSTRTVTSCDLRKVDAYALGCILFIAVFSVPHCDDTGPQSYTYRKLLQHGSFFFVKQWDLQTYPDRECFRLIDRLLHADPKMRLGVTELLSDDADDHFSWLLRDEESDNIRHESDVFYKSY